MTAYIGPEQRRVSDAPSRAEVEVPPTTLVAAHSRVFGKIEALETCLVDLEVKLRPISLDLPKAGSNTGTPQGSLPNAPTPVLCDVLKALNSIECRLDTIFQHVLQMRDNIQI